MTNSFDRINGGSQTLASTADSFIRNSASATAPMSAVFDGDTQVHHLFPIQWTTPEVYNRVKALPQKKLQMAEWTGGRELVIVDAIAPFGDRATLIREIEPQLRAMKGAGNDQ